VRNTQLFILSEKEDSILVNLPRPGSVMFHDQGRISFIIHHPWPLFQ
jgi:hypothetical protein